MNVYSRIDGPDVADARELILAVLAATPAEAELARQVLGRANRLRVDPLDYCAATLGLGQDVVFARAAQWAGFAFSSTVPQVVKGSARIIRIDGLGEVRTLRGRLGGRELTFCAPHCADLVRLAAARTGNARLTQHLCIVPPRAIRAAIAASAGDELLAEARHRLTRQWPLASAELDLTLPTRIVFVVLFGLTLIAMAAAPYAFSLALLPFVTLMILPAAVVRLLAVFEPPRRPPRMRLLNDVELPVYSVLIPLRDEATMVPMLRRAMAQLDYPPEKLDIKFVVERKSTDTVEAVQRILTDPRFDLILIPDARPHTKPKALNYAMPMVRGQYVVVFDAEDIPRPGQLRLAASHFAAQPELDCIQAELVIENAEENWITAMFAAEYAGQFRLLLPWLAHHRFPVPLGGTSNHFRTAALRELGHWDAYNVTEDADLGVRLARLRYRTGILDSETKEEAPVTLDAWMAQRTRWIKGWMQTFIVHNRRPWQFLRDIGWRSFLLFEIYVGSMIVSSLLHSIFLLSLIVRLVFGISPNLADPVEFAYVALMAIGYGASALVVVVGLARRRAWHLMPQQLLVPVYWMMHSIAALRATHQLIVRPYFWGKTAHGRTRTERRVG